MSLAQLDFEKRTMVEAAISVIQENEPPEGYQVAFSGGKDSVVVYDLVSKSGVKFKAFYNWTGIDPPELKKFVQDNYSDVEIRNPVASIWRLIEKHRMLPTRIVRYCCEDLKEASVKFGVLITGIRRQESPSRRKRKMIEVSYKNPNVTFVHPILNWSSFWWNGKKCGDVWEYIHDNELNYCSLYDEGFDRLGCILCPFTRGAVLELEMKRYPKHVEAWRRAANRLFDAGYSHKSFNSGDELFEWWLTREGVREGCTGIVAPKMFFE